MKFICTLDSFRSLLEQYLCQTWGFPLLVVVVGGGPVTLDTMREAVEKQFPVVVIRHSGGIADLVAYHPKYSF